MVAQQASEHAAWLSETEKWLRGPLHRKLISLHPCYVLGRKKDETDNRTEYPVRWPQVSYYNSNGAGMAKDREIKPLIGE